MQRLERGELCGERADAGRDQREELLGILVVRPEEPEPGECARDHFHLERDKPAKGDDRVAGHARGDRSPHSAHPRGQGQAEARHHRPLSEHQGRWQADEGYAINPSDRVVRLRARVNAVSVLSGSANPTTSAPIAGNNASAGTTR